MSKFDAGEFETTGYFLPEDSEFRLKKLCKHMKFLAYLAQPRTANEEQDFMDIRPGEVAVCLELLAEQVELALDTVSFPAHRKSPRAEAADAAGEDDADDEEDGQEKAGSDAFADVDDARVGASAPAVDDDYAFCGTLDQLDEINRLLDLLKAQGDLLMAGGGGEFAKGTLIVIGASIFENVDSLHDIIRQAQLQLPETPPATGLRVREIPPVYAVHARVPARRQGGHRVHLH